MQQASEMHTIASGSSSRLGAAETIHEEDEHEQQHASPHAGDSHLHDAPHPPPPPPPDPALAQMQLLSNLASEWELEPEDALATDAALQAHAHLRAPLKVLGARGLYLVPSRPFLSQRIVHAFPQRSVRLWALLAALLAAGVTIAYLVVTIRGKWLADISNPVTTLTTENVASLPAVSGMITLFHANLWLNRTLNATFDQSSSFRTADGFTTGFIINPLTPLPPSFVIPSPVRSDPLSAGYSWHEVFLRNQKISTDEANAGSSLRSYVCASNPLVLPAPYPMEFCLPTTIGSLDSHTDLPWPLQFTATTDTLCLRSYKLLDTRAAIEIDDVRGQTNVSQQVSMITFGGNHMRFEAPSVFLSLASRESLSGEGFALKPDESGSNGLTQLWSSILPLEYGMRHTIRTRMSQAVSVDGTTTWRTEMEYGGSQRFASAQAELAFAAYFAAAPAFHAELLADPNLQLNSSAPDATQKWFMETCFAPASFQIQRVRSSRSYGAFNFLSDGQFSAYPPPAPRCPARRAACVVPLSLVALFAMRPISFAVVGGFLSLMALAFALAFPFSQVLIRPRDFIGMWAWRAVMGMGAAAGSGQQETEEDLKQQQQPQQPASASAASQRRSSSNPNQPPTNAARRRPAPDLQQPLLDAFQ